jgi:hypothetical protein
MRQINDLIIGLEILEPFLKRQGFVFESYKNEKNTDGHFIVATFKNEPKKFIINYQDSIREVIYQFDNSIVCHDFYLDQLGLADKKQPLNFQSNNKFIAFKHILEDFEFLVSDFFNGDCIKLKEFSKREDNIITIHNEKLRGEYNVKFDEFRIETARIEFTKKDFKRSLEIFNTVEHKNLLIELDTKIIEYCEKHI